MAVPLRLLIAASGRECSPALRSVFLEQPVPSVSTLNELHSRLSGQTWDAVIVDGAPSIEFVEEVLRSVRTQAASLPVLVIAGTIGEAAVADLYHAGISEFIPANDPARLQRALSRFLLPAGAASDFSLHVERAESGIELKSARRRTEEGRKKSDAGGANPAPPAEDEHRLQVLLETIPHMVWKADHTGRTNFLNRQVEEKLGISSAAACDWGWLDLLHPEDRQRSRDHWMKAVREEVAYRNEYRLRVADGSYRWYLAQGVPVRDAGGATMVWLGTWTDIDDLKRSETELRRKKELLRAVADGVPDALFVKDLEGKYLLVNPAAAELFGSSVDEILGQEDSRFFSPELVAYFQQGDQAPLELDKPVTRERLLMLGGKARTFLTTKAPFRDLQGRLQGIIGLARDISAQKEAEEALRVSERQFRSFMEHSPAVAWILDQDLNLLYLNRVGHQSLQFAAENPIGRSLYELFDRQRAEEYSRYVQTVIQTDNYVQTVTEGLYKDGKVGHFLVYMFPLPHPETGMAVGGMALDITGQKHSEEALRTSEQQLRTILNTLPVGVFVTDAQGNITLVNPAAERIWGGAPLVGVENYNLYQGFDPETGRQLENQERALARAVRTGETTKEAEVEIQSFDGTRKTISNTAVPIRGAGGEILGGVAVIEDVTARKKAEQDLRLLDRAMGAVTQGILITDPKQPGNPIIYASPGVTRITGYTPAELLGRNPRALQGPETDRATAQRLHEAIAQGKPCTVEILNYRKDGSSFWNELSIFPVRNDDGLLTHFVSVQTDISARRRLEEQFRHAQKMEAIGQLAGGVAHDFNNLLTVINVYCELLLAQTPPGHPNYEMLREIRKAGERSTGLTKQLLAFSRRQVLTPRLLDLNGVVRDTESMLRRLIGEDIELTTSLPGDLGQVQADAGQLEQVLLNLALNSRDAMPDGGLFTIKTKNVLIDEREAEMRQDLQPGPYVRLTITDTGTGMTPEVMAHIFEPFFTTKAVGQGTGLGLPVVHGIIKQSGGSIQVTSQPGQGTTVTIDLPRSDAPPLPEPKPAVNQPLPHGTETILLVEDEAGVRSLVGEILSSCGYHVLAAAEGHEALRIAENHDGEISLLLTDVVIPTLGGRQLFDQIQVRRPEIRVLFMSGYMDDAVVRRGISRSDVHYLQKPFTSLELATLVRVALEGPPTRFESVPDESV
ncbi:PAS domain S-box protein [Planctomicrobium sp. SH664]|uniref:hybrid sensor histidine kinase/response regulator n=1 Tax=Planctomicrobium sp. SH664 TaxID=3448125 RepID=UPI003F5B0CC2